MSDEIERLKAENARLKARIRALEAQLVAPIGANSESPSTTLVWKPGIETGTGKALHVAGEFVIALVPGKRGQSEMYFVHRNGKKVGTEKTLADAKTLAQEHADVDPA